MSYLLNLLYVLLLLVVSPVLLYRAVVVGKYRRGWSEKLWGQVPLRRGDRPCFWLHAVSVGEVNVLGRLIDALERRYPDCECIISTTTDSGYDLAVHKYAPRSVCYCPLDFSWAIKRALRRLRPDMLVLTELELWPNLLRLAQRNHVRLAIVNARLSERSFRGYKRIGWLMSRLLRDVDVVAAQTDEYAERFLRLGVRDEAMHVTGNMKFDSVSGDRQHPDVQRLARLAGLDGGAVVFLAGSTIAPEEQLALESFKTLADRYPALRLLLVPRHPERFDDVARLLESSGLLWQRRTDLDRDGPRLEARILLVDAVGELGSWWGTAQIGYVGGSLGSRGGQNMIEPSAYGSAICFGPRTENFRDVVAQLLAAAAARVVHDQEQLTQFVRAALEDPLSAQRMGDAARRLVAGQRGATRATVELLGDGLRRTEQGGGHAVRRPTFADRESRTVNPES